eukprot:5842619-Lingulodinium_polyedra.AAC.1
MHAPRATATTGGPPRWEATLRHGALHPPGARPQVLAAGPSRPLGGAVWRGRPRGRTGLLRPARPRGGATPV